MSYNPNIHHRQSIRLKGYDYSQAGLYFITICCQDRACMFGAIKDGEMVLNDAGKMIVGWYYELENKYPDKRCHEMIVMPNHFHCIIENMDGVNESDGHIRDLNAHGCDLDTHGCDLDTHGCDLDTHGCDLNTHGCDLNTHGCDLNGPERDLNHVWVLGAHVGAPLRGRLYNERGHPISEQPPQQQSQHSQPQSPHQQSQQQPPNKIYNAPIGVAIDWFKTMTTNAYIYGVKHLGWSSFNGKLWQRNYYEHIIRNDQSYQTISNYIINNPIRWLDDKFHTT